MKKIAIFLLLLVMSASLFASNIGVVDARAVMAGDKKAEAVYKKLDDMRRKLENELSTEEVEIQKLQVEYNANPTAARQKTLEDRIQKFQASVTSKQQQLAQEETKEMEAIQKRITTAIQKVAQGKGMVQVYEANSLLFGGTNITSEVITEVNR